MGGSYDDLTMDKMRKVLKDNNAICYVAYTVLMDADIQANDVVRIHSDGESVAVTLTSSKLAKYAKELCNKEEVRYGTQFYRAKVKARDKILIVEVKELDTEKIDE